MERLLSGLHNYKSVFNEPKNQTIEIPSITKVKIWKYFSIFECECLELFVPSTGHKITANPIFECKQLNV